MLSQCVHSRTCSNFFFCPQVAWQYLQTAVERLCCICRHLLSSVVHLSICSQRRTARVNDLFLVDFSSVSNPQLLHYRHDFFFFRKLFFWSCNNSLRLKIRVRAKLEWIWNNPFLSPSEVLVELASECNVICLLFVV